MFPPRLLVCELMSVLLSFLVFTFKMDFNSRSSLEDQFNGLSMKFLFVCEDSSGLNALLNELNGLDYKQQQITDSNSIVRFIDSLPKIPVSSDCNVIVKACHLLRQLISKQKVSLPENVSKRVIQWILKCCDQKSMDLYFCEAVDALAVLFKLNSAAAQQVRIV